MPRWACVAVLLLVLPLGSLTAQAPGPAASVPVGARVRVSLADARAPRVIGTLTALSADSLTLRPQARLTGAPVTLPLARVARLELRRGRGLCSSGGRRLACLVVGGLAGIGAGVGLAHATGAPPASDVGPGHALVTVPIGLLLGLAVGGTAGGDGWVDIPLPAARSTHGGAHTAGHLTSS